MYFKIDVFWCPSESLYYTSSPNTYVYPKATEMTMIDHWMYDHWNRISNSDKIYCPVSYYEIRMANGNQNFNSDWLQWANSTFPQSRVRAWTSDGYTETVRIYAYTRQYSRFADQENMYQLEQNTNYPGNDMGYSSKSQVECQKWCTNRPDCTGYLYRSNN